MEDVELDFCKLESLSMFGGGEDMAIMDDFFEFDAASSQEAMWQTKKRGLGKNIEAVRKYRQKKKAEVAFLEDQVLYLRALNEHLAMKLLDLESLEAEVIRLRQMVAEFGGRIDVELASIGSARRRYCEYLSRPHGPSTPNGGGHGGPLVMEEATAGVFVSSCEEEEEAEENMDPTRRRHHGFNQPSVAASMSLNQQPS